jgi:hypothetical protein
MPKASKRASKAPKQGPRIEGIVEVKPLELVQPNDWNPNEMTEFQKESTRYGLLTDGWLASHALTIWGTDEKGNVQNVIIDGEHRWELARDVGYDEGPMVFLHGLTRAQAMALTVKLDARRGSFQQEPLAALIAEINTGDPMFALSIGIDDSALAALSAPQTLPPENSKTTIKAETEVECPSCGHHFLMGKSKDGKAVNRIKRAS